MANVASKRDKNARKQEQRALQREKDSARLRANTTARRKSLAVRIGGALVAIAAVTAAILYALHGSGGPAEGAAAASLGPFTADVASPPTAGFTRVGAPLYQNGKPELLFIGAQYCPHCAGQRWPMVKALSQFGTFSNVKSSSNDDGTIPTFDLTGSTYTSKYVAFDHKDVEDRNHNPLQSLDGSEQALFSRYDQSGAIPLIVVGGYDIIGDSYNLNDISAKSFSTVQQGLQHQQAQPFVADINAETNAITALICHADRMQPRLVCNRSPVLSIASHLR